MSHVTSLRATQAFALFLFVICCLPFLLGCSNHSGSSQPANTATVTSSSSSQSPNLSLADRLQNYIDGLDTDNRAGIAVAVVQNGEVLFQAAKGMANTLEDIPLTINTGFRTASISKTFTAIAVMQLVEAGQINLRASIHDYIPELPASWSAITVSMLLTHSSGIIDLLNDDGLYARIGGMTNSDLTTYFQENPTLEFTPGFRSEYSNTGYMMLALIIERASNIAFGEYMQRFVFEPAGMYDSYINDEKHPLEDYDTLNHASRTTIWGQTYYLVGSMGQVSSVDDFVQFFAALENGQLLSDESLTQLIAHRSTVLGSTSYGYGVMRGNGSYGHGGSLDGFQTDFRIRTDGSLSYVILTNSGGRTRGYLEQVLRIVGES